MKHTISYRDPYHTLSSEELAKMDPLEVLKYLIDINSKRIDDTLREVEQQYPKLFKNFGHENQRSYWVNGEVESKNY